MSNQEIPQFRLFDSLELPAEVQYKIYRATPFGSSSWKG
jgi:hypothetical protein